MNQENKPPSNDFDQERLSFVTFRKKLENNDEDQSSITPKRPLLSRDRSAGVLSEISPLSDRNSRPEQTKRKSLPVSPLTTVKTDQSPVAVVENCMFVISPPQPNRTTIIDDDDNSYVPAYIHRKAKPAPLTTWKPSFPIHKSSKTAFETSTSVSVVSQISFQPAIRPRVPFNLTSTNTIDKQAHAYTIWFNSLFTPVEFMSNPTNTNQSISNEISTTKTLKSLAESNRWYILRDRARELFTRDIQSIATKISADIDIDHCRINPKVDLNFSARTVSRQSLLNFISSYNRIWFRLAMEVLFPINIENYQQMKLSIEQYLIQSNVNNSSPSNDINFKKSNLNNTKTASPQIRLTIKNLILIIIFLERAKLLRLIDNDPCLYTRESKFKSTKESIDILSRDLISSDTNLIRRLKLAGFEPVYRQTSLDEYNYLITNNDNKLFDDLKDGIRLTRCAQILLSSTNEQVARFDLSTKLKCPVVNLVHKLLNIDQAFELLQTYGHINLIGISNKDIMNGNKQRTLELLWRIFTVCYLPKHLSPIEKLHDEISILTENLFKYNCRSVEEQILTADIILLQKQQIEYTPLIHLLIKWAQLICAHYKFWLYDLQESFIDGRAFLYIISYYLPSLCDYSRDIKHLTTLATCQTRDEHIQFNLELGQQQQLINTYERNVKSNFRLLEECIKQFGTFSNELIKYEYYSKDIPDERYTIIVLSMLAHDLIFSNNIQNDNNYRHQSIFEELKNKYSKDDEPIIEIQKDEINQEQIDIIQDNLINISYQTDNISQITETNSIYDEIIITSTTITKNIEEKSLKSSISSTTINFPIEEALTKIHSLPIIQLEQIITNEEIKDEDEENTDEDTTKVTILSSLSPVKQDWSFVEPPAVVYNQTLSDSLYASLETMFSCQTPPRTQSSLTQSVVHTMDNDILDHLETLPEINDESDMEAEAEDEDSFNSARSGLTTTIDPRHTSIAAQTTTQSFHDFVELEKTIENDGTKNHSDNTSLFLIDETTPSEADSVEMNKMDDTSFANPVNTKMIKETLTLFLAHQQQTLEHEESLAYNNESLGQIQNEQQSELVVKSEAERELDAAQIVQAHWRGHQVRAENQRNNHPVVAILEKIRAHDPTNSSSLTLRERMMQIVQEYSEASSSSLTAYLHFLRDVEPIVACCLEIRYLIAQQGLLRLFFILMRCCNRSGPSAVLLSKVLSILQLFTVKRGLIMPLIDKREQIKDFIMLLLKYYQKNRSELFEQICSLLESIVNDEYARKMLRSNKLFTDAIEYVYKRVFNKASAEDEKYRQQIRSTPKQSTGPQTRRATLLNQSSILYPTPKMMRPPVVQNENIFKKNLMSMEKFMKVFYHD
ncbi:unnamed protein product [Rotaria sp. Silwood2]|nr:unnamed protein product [Rotaria sp. Silwood2]CAF2893286.1 unnamed protein product [Rotaria sp. Silwood2]CAF3900882.1 unnamed protein product [Rotaria sp. Silwood2]CAF4050319.1 unnamed protein product [Rotaria sp. Silwood2]